MKKYIFLIFCMMVVSGCSGSGSGSPKGSTLSITPSETLTVESSSNVIESASQIYLIAARDVPPPASSTTPAPGSPTTAARTTAASTTPTGPGIRDVTFSVTFEYANPPDLNILPDITSAVTLCDGTRIINTSVEKMTDRDGNYNLCILYKSGGGLVYSGALRVSSGDQTPSVNIIVTSKPQALAVSPATPQSVPAGSLAQFTIVGGVPGYTITASPSSVLPPVPSMVSSNGGTFLVAVPIGTPDKTAVIYTITDAVGSQVTVTLTVGPPSSLPQVFPASSNVLPGGSAKFTIVNGFPGYTVTSDNPLVSPVPASVAASGGTFTVAIPVNISPNLYDKTISFTIRDSAGSVVADPVKVTILKPQDLTVTPPSVTVNPGGSVQFSILGGVPGYTIASDTASVQPVPATVPASGGTFKITVPSATPAGSINLTVTDSVGQTKTVAVTVASPLPIVITPSSVSVTAGESVQFSVRGGVPGYTVTTGDASIVSVPSFVAASGGTFRITVPSSTLAETVTVTVTDTVGQTATATMNVATAPLPLRILPGAVSASASIVNTYSFLITGGTPPYTTTSDDAAHVYNVNPGSGSWSGSSINVTVNGGGSPPLTLPATVNLVVGDSAGNSATATIRINP